MTASTTLQPLFTHNTVLHAVTNRSNDFVHPALPSASPFHPELVVNPAAASCRKLLRLGDTTTDFWVVAALGALNSFPEIREQFGEQTTSLSAGTLSAARGVPVVVGGSFIPTNDGAPAVRRKPDAWPFELTINLQAMDLQQVRISSGQQSDIATYRVNELGHTFLSQWPDWTGVQGGLLPDSTWGEGSQLSITSWPISVPWSALADVVRNDKACLHILTITGRGEDFYAATTPIEKVAHLLLGLGQLNTAVYPA